jgi:hypothetical protein
VGNHVDLRRLPGGAEGIRTDGHRGRSEIDSYSYLRQSRREGVGPLDFPASLVEFQRQFSDDDACAAIASS